MGRKVPRKLLAASVSYFPIINKRLKFAFLVKTFLLKQLCLTFSVCVKKVKKKKQQKADV